MSLMRPSLRQLLIGLAALAAMVGLDGTRTPARAVGVLVCSFSMSNEVFGSVDVLPGAALSTAGTLTITCGGLSVLQDVDFCVAFPSTTLVGPSSLSYNLLGPSPATTPWSSTTPIVFSVPVLGGSKTVSIPATLLAGQSSAPPGVYTQSVTAVVSFGLTGCTTGSPQTTSIGFTTSATVVKACNVAADPIDFGSIGTLSSAVVGQGRIALQCSNGIGYTIALDGGTSGASDPTQRQMMSGGRTVTYGLYQNSGYSQAWGSAAGSTVLAGTGTSLSQSIPVYGLVPVQPVPPPGTYTDTIVVTVGY